MIKIKTTVNCLPLLNKVIKKFFIVDWRGAQATGMFTRTDGYYYYYSGPAIK